MEGSKKGNKEEGVEQREGVANEEIAETTEEKERKEERREREREREKSRQKIEEHREAKHGKYRMKVRE